MPYILLKRIAICSATVIGGFCLKYWHKSPTFHPDQKHEEDEFIYPPENYTGITIGNDFDESLEIKLNFWEKGYSPIYWQLFMLCKSHDQKIRHKAVESLSKLQLEKWHYNLIAQASDIKTAVGLARSEDASPYFFIRPPFQDLAMGDLQRELSVMLSPLQYSNDGCIRNLVRQITKSQALLLKYAYNVDLEVGDPSVIYHSQRKQKALFTFHKQCLEVLLTCSTERSFRRSLMNCGILELLLRILHAHENDIEIHSLIAQILANLAMEETYRNSIFKTGWIGILSEWKKSQYTKVSLPAVKALANMDCDDISHPIYEDGIYVLSPVGRLSSEKKIIADVIFVHGLLGATFWTWRQYDAPQQETPCGNEDVDKTKISESQSICWPRDWLAKDFPSVRIISVDYKTCFSYWTTCCHHIKESENLNGRAEDLVKKLLSSNVGERPIIWVAHSFGGLIVKQILANAVESSDKNTKFLLEKTIGIVFYSVPHRGSQLASTISAASLFFQPSSDIEVLKKDSPSLLSLHEKFMKIVTERDIPILSFGETKKSKRKGVNISILVPPDSADPGIGEFFTLPVDHLSTCKPTSHKSLEYLKVLNFIKENASQADAKETHKKYPDKISELLKIVYLIP